MGNRATILEAVKDELDDLYISDIKENIHAQNVLFDPIDNSNRFPLFAVVSEPETIELNLTGTRADRSMRVLIQGWDFFQEDKPLNGEKIVDGIVDHLKLAATVNTFTSLAGLACGFGITSMGPILVEQMEGIEEMVYMTVPITVEFIDP